MLLGCSKIRPAVLEEPTPVILLILGHLAQQAELNLGNLGPHLLQRLAGRRWKLIRALGLVLRTVLVVAVVTDAVPEFVVPLAAAHVRGFAVHAEGAPLGCDVAALVVGAEEDVGVHGVGVLVVEEEMTGRHFVTSPFTCIVL